MVLLPTKNPRTNRLRQQDVLSRGPRQKRCVTIHLLVDLAKMATWVASTISTLLVTKLAASE